MAGAGAKDGGAVSMRDGSIYGAPAREAKQRSGLAHSGDCSNLVRGDRNENGHLRIQTMSKPRRVITIHLPHREPFAAAVLVFLLAALGVLGGLSSHLPDLWPAEPEQPALVVPNAQLAGEKLNQRVEALLQTMSLDEKIGQLVQYTAGTLTGPGTAKHDYDDLVAQGEVGSLFNVVGAKLTNRFQHLAVDKSPHHIPLVFGFDVIHGERTIFPVPLALASSWDPDLIEQVARVSAQESAADGVRWVFSPMVDIARDARWGRITEGAGEDTYLGSVLAAAYIRGYQGDDLGKPDSVAACVKHFAAYGAPNAGREYNTVDMSELTLRQVYLPPYHAAINAGAATVMSAFNPLNGVPATADPFTLTKILRQEWRFRGFVVSDYGAVRELIAHGVASTGAIAARKALTSGVEMDMMSDLYRTRLAALVESGDLPESVVDEAARRVLRVKFALGLFDHPYVDESRPVYAATPEKRAQAKAAAEESMVLLKNGVNPVPYAGRTLPIAKNTATIALIGPLADSQIDMLGSWSAAGDEKDAVTLRSALQARCDAAKTKLLYAEGTDILTDSDSGFDDAIAAARQADVGGAGARRVGRQDDRRVVVAHAARPTRQPGAAAGGHHENWQADGAGAVRRPPAGDQVGRRAYPGHPGGVVPRHRGGQRRGRRALRRRESERETHGDVSARGRAGAAFLQPAPDRPPRRRHRPLASADRRGQVFLPLHRRDQRAAVSLRVRPFLHGLHLLRPEAESGADFVRGVDPSETGPLFHAGQRHPRFGHGEEHRRGRGHGGRATLHSQHRRQRRGTGARIEGIPTRDAEAG